MSRHEKSKSVTVSGEGKRGKFSNDEMEYLKVHAHKMSPEELAEKLNRTVETVKKNIKLYAPPPPLATAKETEKLQIRQELRLSEKWKQLSSKFTKQELHRFEEEYVNLMAQFKGDILYTEEAQIFDAITLEIFKDRNAESRKKALEEIVDLEDTMDGFFEKHGKDINAAHLDEKEKNFYLSLLNQLQVARGQEKRHTDEWTKLQERVEKIRQTLKANRDQRTSIEENRGKDFTGVLKWLAEREVQQEQARRMSLMKLSGEKESERLGKPQKYEDGQVDIPILSSTTVANLDDDIED